MGDKAAKGGLGVPKSVQNAVAHTTTHGGSTPVGQSPTIENFHPSTTASTMPVARPRASTKPDTHPIQFRK